MGSQGPKPKPETAPRPQTKMSDLPKVEVPLYFAVDQTTPPVKQEEQGDTIMSSDSYLSSDGLNPKEAAVDVDHSVSAQSYSATLDWTVGEILEMQEANHAAFMKEYRTATSQENTNLVQLVKSELQTGVRNEVQGSMDQIFKYIKGLVTQPTQTADSSEIAALKSQLRAEKTHTKDLTNHYNRLVQASNKQKKDLGKANAKLNEALLERDQLRKLQGGGNLANSEKTTDDAIRGKWKELQYNISCLAHLLESDPSDQHLDDCVSMRLRFLSGSYRRLWKDEDYRQLLMAGYLWVLIQEIVLDSEYPIWGGPGSKHFKIVRDNIIDHIGESENVLDKELSIPHIARWLAQGSTMMSKLWDKDHAVLQRLVNVEAKCLRPFYSGGQPRNDRSEKSILDQLRGIMDSAIELDKMMMCSKAIFQVHWRDRSQKPDLTQRYNKDVMVSEAYENDLSPKSRVRFYISPVLYKVGTADGQSYDSRMVLAKGVVVCE
ncbi:hypothetical protein BKA59DRAFT_522155 [Fusarium tricinctum]|uniref:Uncharacterized protein n=1 Tax=Fusarium tricinctum TaxID=61284 RepID=A0A8K0WFL0_9HYPO|nr:hypothetical protein BKA59DRAFT_522155 [Fusarium tricinctum]